VEAAFFDLDKTVIATSSVMALGGTLYRDGLISKRTIVRGLYAQVVYLLVGADENKMDRMREAMLTLTRGLAPTLELIDAPSGRTSASGMIGDTRTIISAN
jgi:hypothetical protein